MQDERMQRRQAQLLSVAMRGQESDDELPPPLDITDPVDIPRFMAEHERLECNDRAMEQEIAQTNKQWLEVRSRFQDLCALAAGQGRVERLRLQELLTLLDEQGLVPYETQYKREKQLVTQVLDNVDMLVRPVMDMALHRPADMGLPDPGSVMQVAVDTPTNGRAVTDEEFSLHNYGLDISLK